MDLLITLFFIFVVLALLAFPLAVGASVGHLFSRGRPSPPPVDNTPARTYREIWLENIRELKAEKRRRREEMRREIDAAVTKKMRNRD